MTALALPTTELEAWRYSRIADLDLDAFRPVPAALRAEAETGTPLGLRGPAADALDAFHDAHAGDATLVRIPAGTTVREPITVTLDVQDDGVAVAPHLVVDAGADSEATVVFRRISGDGSVLVVPEVELRVGDAARIRFVDVQQLGTRTWQLGQLHAEVGSSADLRLTLVSLGGDYSRLATHTTLAGRGGSAELHALYFGDGDQMHDLRTFQHHRAPDTTSNLVGKGAVQDRSHAVYTGLIHIAKDAPRVIAFQENRNITLSDGAWAESVPNLDIENNDVRCSHASAVGPVDEDQRFYLESRGVPPETAEQLIVLGFLDELLGDVPVPAIADELRMELVAKLGRRQ